MTESRTIQVEISVRLELRTSLTAQEAGRRADTAVREELRSGRQIEVPGVGYARLVGTDFLGEWPAPPRPIGLALERGGDHG